MGDLRKGKNGQNGHQSGQKPGGKGAAGPGPAGATSAGRAPKVIDADSEPDDLEAFESDLDACWELVDSGKIAEARLAAAEIRRRYQDTPEVYVLLGTLDSIEGDPEAALKNFEEAMELDPDFIEPLLCAAEIYIWELGEHEKGLKLCQKALDLAEEESEYLDALLLKADAEVNLGHEDRAYATLSEIPDIPVADPSYHIRAARLFLDLNKLEEAQHHFQLVVERLPDSADALHGLGLCAERRGDRKTMIRCYQKVRQLDLREPSPPWGLSAEKFSAVCEGAIESLPAELQTRLKNVPIIAQDYPSAELVADGTDPRLLGLFAGVPYGDKSTVGGAPHLDTIFLFQRNIERMAISPEDVEDEIQITLVHEAGHFFGLSDEQLEAMGLG